MKSRVKTAWPDHESEIELAEEFSKYFVTKIDDIMCELDANTPIVDNDIPSNSIVNSVPIIPELRVVSPEEVKKLVNLSVRDR